MIETMCTCVLMKWKKKQTCLMINILTLTQADALLECQDKHWVPEKASYLINLPNIRWMYAGCSWGCKCKRDNNPCFQESQDPIRSWDMQITSTEVLTVSLLGWQASERPQSLAEQLNSYFQGLWLCYFGLIQVLIYFQSCWFWLFPPGLLSSVTCQVRDIQ